MPDPHNKPIIPDATDLASVIAMAPSGPQSWARIMTPMQEWIIRQYEAGKVTPAEVYTLLKHMAPNADPPNRNDLRQRGHAN